MSGPSWMPGREQTVSKEQGKAEVIDLQVVLERDTDFIRAAMRAVVRAVPDSE